MNLTSPVNVTPSRLAWFLTGAATALLAVYLALIAWSAHMKPPQHSQSVPAIFYGGTP